MREILTREKHQLVASCPRIEPATYVCALARDQTCNLLVHGTALQPTKARGLSFFPFPAGLSFPVCILSSGLEQLLSGAISDYWPGLVASISVPWPLEICRWLGGWPRWLVTLAAECRSESTDHCKPSLSRFPRLRQHCAL